MREQQSSYLALSLHYFSLTVIDLTLSESVLSYYVYLVIVNCLETSGLELGDIYIEKINK